MKYCRYLFLRRNMRVNLLIRIFIIYVSRYIAIIKYAYYSARSCGVE